MASLYSVQMISIIVLFYANAGENPNFKCSVLMDKVCTLLAFSLKISQRPNRNTVMFLVNKTTVDKISLYNKTCYNKKRACTDDMCACDYTGNVFKMRYVVHKKDSVYVNTTFGVQMTLKERNGKRIQMTLRRLFDGKEFGNLMTSASPIAHEFAQEQTKVSTHNLSSGTETKGILTVIFIIAVVIGMFLKLCYGYRNISSYREVYRIYRTQ